MGRGGLVADSKGDKPCTNDQGARGESPVVRGGEKGKTVHGGAEGKGRIRRVWMSVDKVRKKSQN